MLPSGNYERNTNTHTPDADPVISKDLWVYFALAIPLTVAIVGAWFYLSRRRKSRLRRDQLAVENDVDLMEREIMATMRRRTLRTESTWASIASAKS